MKIKIRSTTRSIFFVFFTLFALFTTGCGYKPFSPIREEIKTIYVPTFKNSTHYPNISAVVTDALRREIILDGTFKLADKENAQASLIGVVKDFKRSPLIYDEEDNIVGGSLTLNISVRFISIPGREILWKNDFKESESANYFLAGSLAKTEDEVTYLVAEKIARRIIEQITEPW